MLHAGILIAVPIMVGFIVSRIFAEPFYEVAQRYNSQIFALSDREKIEGAKEVCRKPMSCCEVLHMHAVNSSLAVHGAVSRALLIALHIDRVGHHRVVALTGCTLSCSALLRRSISMSCACAWTLPLAAHLPSQILSSR